MRAHVNAYLNLKRAVALEFVPLRNALRRPTRANRFVQNQRAALAKISEQLRMPRQSQRDGKENPKP